MNALEKYAAKRLLINELTKVAVVGIAARAMRGAPSVGQLLKHTGGQVIRQTPYYARKTAIQVGRGLRKTRSAVGRTVRRNRKLIGGGVGGGVVGAEIASPGSTGRGLQRLGRNMERNAKANPIWTPKANKVLN